MSTVVLIRPGSTDYDEQQRIQGSLDLPLNERGLEQVDDVVEQLRDLPLEAIYTGPNEPSVSTARAIGSQLGIRVKEVDELRNLNQGLWEGLQLDDVRRKYPKVFKQWEDAPESICPPQGETFVQALERVRDALQKPLKRKHVFAVVASEPMATLIRSVVLGNKPECPGPLCGCAEGKQVELVETNGSDAAVTPLNGTNGRHVELPPAVRLGTAPRGAGR